MTSEKLSPVHPGEILREEFLTPMEINSERLAQDIGVPEKQIRDLLQEQRAIDADMALRLARYFDMSPQFWLGLQMDYDLDVTQDSLEGRLDREVKTFAAAG